MFNYYPPLNTSREIQIFAHFVQQQRGYRNVTALGMLPGENFLSLGLQDFQTSQMAASKGCSAP